MSNGTEWNSRKIFAVIEVSRQRTHRGQRLSRSTCCRPSTCLQKTHELTKLSIEELDGLVVVILVVVYRRLQFGGIVAVKFRWKLMLRG